MREHVASLAAALRKESDVQVNVIDGARGELSVEIDGHVIARKTSDKMPDVHEVVDAVRHEPAHA